MCTQYGLRQSSGIKTAAPDFLDRYNGAALFVGVATSSTILDMKGTPMRLFTKLLTIALLPVASAFAAQQSTVLDVQNMTCSLCPVTVKKALQNVPGVEAAKVDFGKKTATVKFDPAKVNTAALVKATTDAGFPSTLHR